MDRNGYFQLQVKEDGTYLKILPPTGEGLKLRFEEVLAYLSRQKISGFDLPGLNRAVVSEEEKEVKLIPQQILPVTEELFLSLSQDKMQAVARFYPPSSNGSRMDKDEILRGLVYQGIKHGLLEEKVDEFVKNREYCKDYVVAMGTPVQEGTDAVITYNFNLNPNARPKLKEDGSVDFHQLENINGVTEGMVIATLAKEVPGQPGRDVAGVEIRPRQVEVKRLFPGKNMELLKEGTELIAKVNGHVVMGGDGKIIVSNIFEVKGDVDASTGDITYDGNVTISGNVLTGFKVCATGDVEVEGVVEAAKIIAGGKIIIRRGIQGMGKGTLQARGNILCRFIESASVMSGASIEADAIMHSRVSAKDEIHVAGKKGLIVGGQVRAGKLIESMVIGSPMGSNTTLEVGTDPELQDKVKKMEVELKRLTAEENKLRQILEVMKIKKSKGQLTADQVENFQKVLINYSEIKKQMASVDEELAGSYEVISETEDASIRVKNVIYSGVKLVIGGEFTITSGENTFCKFIKDWHEIKRVTL